MPGPLSDRVVSYRIEARLLPEEHVVEGKERIAWRNVLGQPATGLAFHLYMNAFKNEASVFMREARRGSGRYVRTPSRWGAIDVRSLRVGGEELVSRVVIARCPEDEPEVPDCPLDETVMEVPLSAPVPPGGTLEVEVEFRVQLPEIVERTGFAGDFHMVGQWFPKLGVWEQGPEGARWNCHAFHADSEFFADFGEYEVELTVPAGWVVGATGVLVDERPSGATRTLVYRAEDVHDFAWVADPEFREARDAFEDVEIRLLYRPGSEGAVRRQLDAAKAALAFFGGLAFPYPYRSLTLVEPSLRGLNAGGMEYPTLVTTLPGFLGPESLRVLEETVVHEIGHNWFQGMIASNEFEEAWLDEGITTYATGLYLEARYGSASAFRVLGLEGAELQRERRAVMRRPAVDPLETFSWRFAPGGYSQVYSKAAVALRTLEGYLGRERMRACLRHYALTQRFRHPKSADFYAACSAAAGEDLDWFFGQAFRGTDLLDHEVVSVVSERRATPSGLFDREGGRVEVKSDDPKRPPVYDTEVVLRRRGGFRFPVDVEVTFADGSRQRVGWDGADAWRAFRFVSAAPAIRAVADPDRRIPLDVDWLNNGRESRPSRAPARRMRLGLAFLVQTLLQALGP